MKQYKIGDKLYRRASPNTLTYEVIGVRDYGDSKQYELECQSCQHGEKCRVLTAHDDYNKLRVVHMLHDDEDYICKQRPWHSADTPFHETLDGVRRELLTASITYYQEEIKRIEANLTSARRMLSEHENSLAIIEAQS